MKTSEAFPSNYLKAADLGDRQWELVIASYEMEELQGQDFKKQIKPVLYFRRSKKGLVLNVTNSRTIETAYGDEMDDWIGKTVVLYTREVEARGETVNAIRVRIPQVGKSTAPSYRQPRPAPREAIDAREFQSGLPDREAPSRGPPAAAEHTERNPPPHEPEPGSYRADMDDDIPF